MAEGVLSKNTCTVYTEKGTQVCRVKELVLDAQTDMQDFLSQVLTDNKLVIIPSPESCDPYLPAGKCKAGTHLVLLDYD